MTKVVNKGELRKEKGGIFYFCFCYRFVLSLQVIGVWG